MRHVAGGRPLAALAAILAAWPGLSACSGLGLGATPVGEVSRPTPAAEPAASATPAIAARPAPLNVYAATMGTAVPARLAGIKPRVYVPNSNSNTVDVIDPATFEVVDRFTTGNIPHHVAPAPDMSTLYVDNEGSSTLTQIDIRTGRPERTIPVTFPYNLYFTLDGTRAVVVAERLRRIEFWDIKEWKQLKVVDIPWAGPDHLDFTADGHYLFISTEWTGQLARVDTEKMELAGSVAVGGLPVDVRLAPDGSVFYVANQGRHGVSLVDPVGMKEVAFIPTARGAHGLQVSRDTKLLYVSNRDSGTISIIDFASREVVSTWRVGGSPDMMQLSPDGRQLWVSSRYDAGVLVVDTADGKVIKRIAVGPGAHGLTYFPNVGSISTGHNGVYR